MKGLLHTDIPLDTAVLLCPQGNPLVFVAEDSQFSSLPFCITRYIIIEQILYIILYVIQYIDYIILYIILYIDRE